MSVAAVSSSEILPPCSHPHPSHRHHDTTHLNGPDGGACIDLKLAPLVLRLWRLGCRTRYSCQDSSGRADVSFLTATDLEVAFGDRCDW